MQEKMGQADAAASASKDLPEVDEHGQGKVPGCEDDCWIISSSSLPKTGQPPPSSPSSWWGADNDNNVELTPLVGRLAMLKNRNSCYAFKSINISWSWTCCTI